MLTPGGREEYPVERDGGRPLPGKGFRTLSSHLYKRSRYVARGNDAPAKDERQWGSHNSAKRQTANSTSLPAGRRVTNGEDCLLTANTIQSASLTHKSLQVVRSGFGFRQVIFRAPTTVVLASTA
jgi:hypothetical protein